MNLTSRNCIIITACRCIPERRLESYLQRLSCASPVTLTSSKNDCCLKIMNTLCLHCHYNGWVFRAHVILPWDLVQYLLFHHNEVYCYHIWSYMVMGESKLVRVCMEVMMPISKNISLYLIFKILKIVSWYFPRAEALYFSTFLFFGLLALFSYRPLFYKDKWV